MRKIIQLAPTYDEDEYLVMYALADDGTVWLLDSDEDGQRWKLFAAGLPEMASSENS